MKYQYTLHTAAGALALLLSTAGGAAADPASNSESRGSLMADSKVEIQQTTREATALFQKFTKGASAQISAEALRRAECVAVFPGITQVAIAVGGGHGNGVVTCKTALGWSNMAPLDLTGASIGAQIGAKRTDLVLLLNSQKAKMRLENGVMTLGADVSVAASEVDRKAMAADASTQSADVVAFAEERGLFAGASLNGTGIRINAGEVKNLYGKEVPFSDLLGIARNLSNSAAANEFIQALPPVESNG